jgi:hypothetical protein
MTEQERVRLRGILLGKEGVISELLRDLKHYSSEERKQRGEAINRLTAEAKRLL